MLKYFPLKILMLVSLVSLVGCSYLSGVKAVETRLIASLQLNKQTSKPVSILPPKPSGTDLATPLTYKIETYHSEAMGENRTFGVSLPPGYEEQPTQRYPVIFLLHGGHGNPKDWFEKKGNALMTLQKLYTTGKLPPSIVITPDGNDKRGSSAYWDPQYMDGPHGKVATAIGDELVKVISARYRTLPNPDYWAIGGLSSGGWGAMNVGLHNVNNFSILFSHSGYFKDKSGPQNSPIEYIKNIPLTEQKRLRVYLDSGRCDVEEVEEARKFTQVLSQQKVYNMFRQYPGSHTWEYWRSHLADSLTFVGEQFQISQIAHAVSNVEQDQDKL